VHCRRSNCSDDKQGNSPLALRGSIKFTAKGKRRVGHFLTRRRVPQETETAMSRKNTNKESFEERDKLAQDASSIQPLTLGMRQEWQAARRTGTKRRVGRPAKDPRLKSRIVPISIEPALLAKIDKFAKSVGVSRSRLVAEGLKLRLSS